MMWGSGPKKRPVDQVVADEASAYLADAQRRYDEQAKRGRESAGPPAVWAHGILRHSPEEAVAEEALAYLHGTYARYLQQHHKPLPPWAWLNAVAHGSPFHIRQLSAGMGHDLARGLKVRQWRQAVHFVAQEMVQLAEAGHHSIPEQQAMALVPLEERLLLGSERRDYDSPAGLAACALVALPRPLREHRHPT
jgi:hypothetical protein